MRLVCNHDVPLHLHNIMNMYIRCGLALTSSLKPGKADSHIPLSPQCHLLSCIVVSCAITCFLRGALRDMCLHAQYYQTQARAGTAPRDSGGTGGFWEICSKIHKDDMRDTKCDSSVFVDACTAALPHVSTSPPACKQ